MFVFMSLFFSFFAGRGMGGRPLYMILSGGGGRVEEVVLIVSGVFHSMYIC